ncbi:peptide ABC transporter substrate-binding protein [Microbacterium sp. gxy059]|uniref:peptide ABC transporter substrate-binding protein n=1 Tax=Microbacterium sp. gxy059 TaxID=2957199 RepID=UPI003D98869A
MKRNKIALAGVGLLGVGALVLAGCRSDGGGEGGSAGGDGAAGDGVIRVNGTEPQNPLIPTNTNEVGGGKIVDSLFAGLVSYDASGAAVNDVAEEITVDSPTELTVKIREGLTFTDGEEVTADNFIKAWNYGAALDNAHLSSYFFEDIEGFRGDENVEELSGLEQVDDYPFTITLNKPASDFAQRLGYSASYPLPDAAFEDTDAFGQNPVGNGLDILDNIPETQLASFESEFEGRAINQPAALNQTITIPERLEHFSGEEGDLRRQAISMAIDRDEIAEVIFEGTRSSMTDFTSPVVDGFTEDVPGNEVLQFDPEKAAELWAEADAISPFDGTFEIGYHSDSSHQGWVDAVANQLVNNLDIDAAGAPYPTFQEFRNEITSCQIESAFRTGWQADYPGLYNFLGPLYATGAGSNDGDYSSEDFDSLLADGISSTDADEANELFTQAQSVLLEDLRVIPLWYQQTTGAHSENVDNVEFGWNSVPLYHEVTKG